MAAHHFAVNWGQQYSCQIELTFMPEVYPGMILVFPSFGVQAYVQEVTHTGDLTGGGFHTRPTLVAWSSLGNAVIKGLPRAGEAL